VKVFSIFQVTQLLNFVIRFATGDIQNSKCSGYFKFIFSIFLLRSFENYKFFPRLKTVVDSSVANFIMCGELECRAELREKQNHWGII